MVHHDEKGTFPWKKTERKETFMDNNTKKIGIFCILLIVIGTAVYFLFTTGNGKLKEQAPESAVSQSQHQDTLKSSPTSVDETSGGKLPIDLKAALNEPNPGDRIKAILGLRKIKTEESIRALEQFLNDKNNGVVEEALDALLAIGAESDELKGQVFAILVNRAQDEDFVERDEALVGAARLGLDNQILPVIQSFIETQDENGAEELRMAAARALTFVNPDAGIDQAIKLVELSNDPTINRIAFNIFAKSDSPVSLEILKESLNSNDKTKQMNGVWALTRKSNPKFNAIIKEALIENSLGKDALAMIAQSPSAPDVFQEVFSSNEVSRENQLACLKVLEEHALNAPNEVRRGLKTTLEPLLNSDDHEVEVQAIKTLGRIGGGIDTAEVIRPKLESEDIEVRRAAIVAYASYTTPGNYKPMLDLLWDDDKKVRESVLIFAGRFINDSDKEVLEKALQHEDEVIRKQAAAILQSLQSKE